MPARTRKPAPAPEPEVEETEETGGRAMRGPSSLHVAHAAYLAEEYGVAITAEQVYLAQTTRKEFRTTEGSGYKEALDEIEAKRGQALAARQQRAEAREANKQAEDVEAGEPNEKPARKRRGKAAAEETETEAPVETARTRSRRRGTAAEAAPATETPAPAPARTRAKKAPF